MPAQEKRVRVNLLREVPPSPRHNGPVRLSPSVSSGLWGRAIAERPGRGKTVVRPVSALKAPPLPFMPSDQPGSAAGTRQNIIEFIPVIHQDKFRISW